MKNNVFILLLLMWSSLLSAVGANSWESYVPREMKNSRPLIPYPAHVKWEEGEVNFLSLKMDGKKIKNLPYYHWIQQEMDSIGTEFFGKSSQSRRKSFTVAFHTSPSISVDGYRLTVTRDKVEIFAADFGGFFNGMQTLRQMIEISGTSFTLPLCHIEDQPAFKIRGVMLDVGRYYLSVPFIKTIVRELSRYKINLLHLHLTDDPGWRAQVKQYPQLTDSLCFWKTRLPGKFYTQEEITDIINYCASFNINVLPEVDIPGHSEPFTKAFGTKMQSEAGLPIVKKIFTEITPLFPYPLFHIGSDEVRFTMKEFMPEMIAHIRSLGKEVVVWHPGYVPDDKAILMCWGENEKGIKMNKTMRHIDTNGFYLDWMDAQSGVLQVFFQQPCEVPEGNDKALGSIMPVWADGNLSNEKRILIQYPFYPCAITFAERIWRGAPAKDRSLMAQLPHAGTSEAKAFAEFEKRLTQHRDLYFADQPFAYVQQSQVKWNVIGPFNHGGENDKSFEPEKIIKSEYVSGDTILRWDSTPVRGAAVQIRDLYTMFGMPRKCKPNHWPTQLSQAVGTGNGTCYAVTYIDSPRDQEIDLMVGINGMWGHSGGYRTAPAPKQGEWDFSGGDIWINDHRLEPPHWPFESIPWGGWGKGRIEENPISEEGYFFRPPVKVQLKKGLNKVLIRSVFGHWKGDEGERKWMFCLIPVKWDGIHYTEVEGLTYRTLDEIGFPDKK